MDSGLKPLRYEAANGDLNTLDKRAATGKATPVAVFAMHNRFPYPTAVDADGPIRTPADLAGRRLVSHPEDAWKFSPSSVLPPKSIRLATPTEVS